MVIWFAEAGHAASVQRRNGRTNRLEIHVFCTEQRSLGMIRQVKEAR